MPRTFGGGTTDRVNVSAQLTQVDAFVYGWWYPTTLTATRGLWSFGNTVGAEIDTTTDELRLRTDNTTDGQWTTAGVDLAVNTWTFLAFLLTQDNTNGAAWRVWRAGLETYPVEATVSVAVARSGNFTGGTSFYVGNKGTGSLAFQGSIGPIGFITTNIGTQAEHPFHLATIGQISNGEADLCLRRLVQHAWLANYWWFPFQSIKGSSTSTGTGVSKGHIELHSPGVDPLYVNSFTGGNNIIQSPTIVGGAISTVAHPRPPMAVPSPELVYRRR